MILPFDPARFFHITSAFKGMCYNARHLAAF